MAAHGEASGFYAHPSMTTFSDVGSSYHQNAHHLHTNRGCRRYPKPCSQPVHMTNPSSLVIETDDGKAVPNARGVIEIGGASNSGLMTMVSSNNKTDVYNHINNRIEFENLRDLTPYVVNNDSENGNPSQYTTLHDALNAASEDPVSDPCTEGSAVIVLTPSKLPYMLTDALTTDRRISITAVSTGGGTAFIESDGIVKSYGNKSWSGVTFRGNCTHYFLTSSRTKPQVEDKFNAWSEFRENAKVSTDYHKLKFRHVFFNYGELSRDAVLEADGGCGIIDACYCKFNICRCGKTDARSFIRHCVDTSNSETRILHSYGQLQIEGREPFNFADLQGTQLFRFEHNTFVWRTAAPEQCAMFGTTLTEEDDCEEHCKTAIINGHARLEIGHSTIGSPDGQNMTLINNLATGERNIGLLVLFSHFRGKHIYKIDVKVPDGQASGLYTHNCFLAGISDAPLFLVNHSDNNDFEYRVVASPHQTFSSEPFYRFNQTGSGNNVEMFTQAFHMLHFGQGSNPVSIEGNIDTTTVNYESVASSGVNPAVGITPILMTSAIV